MSSLNKISVSTLALLVTWASTANAQAPAVPVTPAPPVTIWRFMGIPQGIQKIRDVTTNRRGNRPGLERKPAMTRIADPANLASDNPAIKAAAEIKQAEDMKKQKIKAIKYLATVGCGCYDKDGKITAALLAATDDCTPAVRLAAIEAVAAAATGGCCRKCGSTSCCNEEISKRLSEMAYERDDDGCPVEPSAEIRAAAKQALCICCPNRVPFGLIEEDIIDEAAEEAPEELEAPITEGGASDEEAIGESEQGAESAEEAEVDSDEDAQVQSESDEQVSNTMPRQPQMLNADAIIAQAISSVTESAAPTSDSVQTNEAVAEEPKPSTVENPAEVAKNSAGVLVIGGMAVEPVSISPASFQGVEEVKVSVPVAEPAVAAPQAKATPAPTKARPRSFGPVAGKVTFINHRTGELLLRAEQIERVNPHGKVDVFHRYLTGERQVGQLKIEQVGTNLVKARVTDLPNVSRMHVGDRVVLR